VIFTLLQALTWLVIADALLSWVLPSRTRFPRNWTTKVTDPLYAPIRRVLNPERTGGLDLSPMVVLLLIQVLRNVLAYFFLRF
jgi:YggT family protein